MLLKLFDSYHKLSQKSYEKLDIICWQYNSNEGSKKDKEEEWREFFLKKGISNRMSKLINKIINNSFLKKTIVNG